MLKKKKKKNQASGSLNSNLMPTWNSCFWPI